MKTVLITGSNRGIGRALAQRASDIGYRVILHVRKSDSEFVAWASRLPNALVMQFDLLDDSAMRKEVSSLLREIGNIDILVNNAGTITWTPLEKQSFEQIEQGVRVNLEAPIKLTRLILPHLREGIINIASAASKVEYDGPGKFENETVYAASKFGLRGFSFVMAKERADLKVLCVNPGGVATDMNDGKGASPQELATQILDAYDKIVVSTNYKELDTFWT